MFPTGKKTFIHNLLDIPSASPHTVDMPCGHGGMGVGGVMAEIKVLSSGYVLWRLTPYVFAQWPKDRVCSPSDVFTCDGTGQHDQVVRMNMAWRAQQDWDEFAGKEA